jgi:four helix bundle protein
VQSYKDLEIYKMSQELAVKVHKMSLVGLPKIEMYEEGSQIRRASKSVVSNIVEGFGRKQYQQEFIKFLTYALASVDETKSHLDLLFETGSLSDDKLYKELHGSYEVLGKKIFCFREAVINGTK